MRGKVPAIRSVALSLVLSIAAGSAQERRNAWDSERVRMVRQQIEARGVRNPQVLEAMRSVRREDFVPAEVRSYATADSPLPIGYRQTISQPYIVAFMTELLEVESLHRVLEIGTGSGYQAAVLAMLCEHVYSVEIVPELAERAVNTLGDLGYRNVSVLRGDGYRGWPEHAPYDRIVVTAAPPELPQTLIEQLADGGRLVAPVGRDPDLQQIVLVTKDSDGNVRRRNQLPVRFVPMVREDGGQ